MHENRVPQFLSELGGAAEQDLAILYQAMALYLDFFGHTFSSKRAVMPTSTLLAHYMVCRKLFRFASATGLQRPRILEIGAGCGYLAFFLKLWPDLGCYTQIEAAPSFYVLQHWINKFLFGPAFTEHANPETGLSETSPAAAFLDQLPQREVPRFVDVRSQSICNHYPWWKIGAAANDTYDIVVSNANLNEFSRDAFVQYAHLAYSTLSDEGIFFAQCFGGGQSAQEDYLSGLKRIFEYLFKIGFAPVFLTLGPMGHNPVPAGRPIAGMLNQLPYCLPNAVLVKRTHPLYQTCKAETFSFPVIHEVPWIAEMFFPNQAGTGRMLKSDELNQILSKQ